MLILEYDSTEIVPGGAGNAANNVAALGGARRRSSASPDRTKPGARLLEVHARRDVDVRGVVRPRGYRTPTKTRILAGGVHSAKQQVVRIDRAVGPRPVDRVTGGRSMPKLLAAAARCDALLVSDYGTGLVTPALVAPAQTALRRAAAGAPPVLVDSRYALLRFRGMTTCTPNESEVEQLFGVRIGDERPRARAGRPRAAEADAGGARC